SKSGVFKHFGDKDELYLAVLEASVDRFLALAWTPALKIAPGKARLKFIFERWLDWVETEGGPGGCPMAQASVEFDDQPGRVRDFLATMHRRWGKTLGPELRLLRDPPLTPQEIDQAVFDMRSYVMGFSQQRRLLDDLQARRLATGAFSGLIERLSLEPALT
ncbi:MAG: TetR/AcrR family transcriptional regulator, partial [Alphaproteobacteria bacterium]